MPYTVTVRMGARIRVPVDVRVSVRMGPHISVTLSVSVGR